MKIPLHYIDNDLNISSASHTIDKKAQTTLAVSSKCTEFRKPLQRWSRYQLKETT